MQIKKCRKAQQKIIIKYNNFFNMNNKKNISCELDGLKPDDN